MLPAQFSLAVVLHHRPIPLLSLGTSARKTSPKAILFCYFAHRFNKGLRLRMDTGKRRRTDDGRDEGPTGIAAVVAELGRGHDPQRLNVRTLRLICIHNHLVIFLK